ncbi:MAG TPA: hypothetical protein VIK75_00360 [Calditerricola sp.]
MFDAFDGILLFVAGAALSNAVHLALLGERFSAAMNALLAAANVVFALRW